MKLCNLIYGIQGHTYIIQGQIYKSHIIINQFEFEFEFGTVNSMKCVNTATIDISY